MEITYHVRKAFFDRMAVMRRMSKARQRVLSKAGAFVRRSAVWSLRRSKWASKPGRPPHIHTGSGAKGPGAGLRWILFAYDHQTDSVVVGPVRFNQQNTSWIDMRNRTVPEILEHGDVVTVHEWRFTNLGAKADWGGWGRHTSTERFAGTWRRKDRRWRDHARKRGRHGLSDLGVETRTRKAVYRPRPFMGPALRVNQAKFPKLFQDSIGP